MAIPIHREESVLLGQEPAANANLQKLDSSQPTKYWVGISVHLLCPVRRMQSGNLPTHSRPRLIAVTTVAVLLAHPNLRVAFLT